MFWQLSGVRQALGLRASSRTRDRALLLGLLFKRDGLWGEVRGPWKRALFSRFGLPCWGQKTWNFESTQRRWKKQWIDETCMWFTAWGFPNWLLTQGKLSIVTVHLGFQFGPTDFYFFVYHQQHGRKKTVAGQSTEQNHPCGSQSHVPPTRGNVTKERFEDLWGPKLKIFMLVLGPRLHTTILRKFICSMFENIGRKRCQRPSASRTALIDSLWQVTVVIFLEHIFAGWLRALDVTHNVSTPPFEASF